MAKVKIKLNLSKDEDLREYNLFNNAANLNSCLFDISHNLKREIERLIEEDQTVTKWDVLDITFKRISEILEENNINPDNLV